MEVVSALAFIPSPSHNGFYIGPLFFHAYGIMYVFAVTAAGAVPGGGRTPEEALDQLRRVLARRSYAGLMRVLSPATRAAVEQDLRGLVNGLDRPETLPVTLTGDSASITVPGDTCGSAFCRSCRPSGWP